MTQLIKNMLEGAGSIIRLFPAEEPQYISPLKHSSAEEALRSDWEAVGRDMWKAIRTVGCETEQTRR